MNLTTQKRIAAEILKCGLTRVRVQEHKDVEEALTREDIRALIKKKMVWSVQKKGTARGKARQLLRQKKKGRRRGDGSKKGRFGGSKKAEWASLIRAQRRLLSGMRDDGTISTRDYRTLYLRAKGGMFRSRKHLLSYLREHDMLKGGKR